MSFALLFWILMLLWLLFSVFQNWPYSSSNIYPLGGNLLLFILIALLGWHAFGAPVHG